jgi:hypothetical protein
MYRLKTALTVMMIGSFLVFSLPGCTSQPTGTSNDNAPPTGTAASPGQPPGASGPQAMVAASAPVASPCTAYPVPSPVPTPPLVDDKPNQGIPCSVSVPGSAFSGNGEIGMGAATAQPFFDLFSWRSFVALNWPTDGTTIGQNGDNPTVWETYNESYQVFLADGSQPHWGPPENVPSACQNPSSNMPVFRMTAKVSQQVASFNKGQVLDERGQPFKTGPLIDPRGEYVRFAIHLNRETFDYILAHQLYNKEGQAAFNAQADLPAGSNGTNPPQALGSIVIKSAWRVLNPATDHLERYHTIKAFVYNEPTQDPPVQARCEIKTLGLIGFHIMHKTSAAPQWIWSTFEQVDNVQADTKAGVPATFFDPKHPERKINQPPNKPWDPSKPATPSQLARLTPIDKATIAMNQKWQAMLAAVNPKSVWQFYQLISTQWPTHARIPDPKDKTKQILNGFGAPAPPVLANITLETYTQRSSSCIACHKNATQTNGQFGDFSYLLQRAQPEKKQ